MKKQRNNGITLIALVITIIVLLILAGVTIASITGENGILGKAQSAKTKTDLKAAEEKVKMAIMAARSNDGTLAIDNLRTEIENEGGTLGDETDFPVTATVDGKTFTIDQNGNVESAGARPQLTEIKITRKNDGTGDVEDNTAGENEKLYITFKASLENGTITEVKNDQGKAVTKNGELYVTEITENGTYTFTVKGTVDGEERETKGIRVVVKKYENIIKTGTIVELTSTLGTQEKFYVLSYDESTNKAKVLAMYNLKVGNKYDNSASTSTPINTNSTGYGLQDETMKGYDINSTQICNGVLAFSASRYWNDTYSPQGNSSYPYVYDSNSNLYQYVEAYKAKLGNTDKVSDVKLASYEDINSLWSEKSKYPWLYSTSYWLGSSDGTSSNGVWCVDSGPSFSSHYSAYDNDTPYGVRPVLTIDMSKV